MERDVAERELVSRIAWAYYAEGMTQSEVAQWLGLSRVRVVRLLQLAREEGYVQILLDTDRAGCFALERRLEAAWGLTRAVVIPEPASADSLKKNIGQAAGSYLAGVLRDGHSLGLGWGMTVAAAAQAVPRQPAQGLTVVSLYGGLPHSVAVNPYEIVAAFARRLKAAHTFYIAAPMFAPCPETCRLLKSQELFRYVYAKAVTVDTALIGLGELSEEATNVTLGAISREEAASLARAGAVGEVFGAFVDPQGNPVDHPLNQRFMGPSLDMVRAIGLRVAAAGGPGKERIIRAALAGGFVNVLVTDETQAMALLETSPGVVS